MQNPTMDITTAYAIATDAGDRHMRLSGRTKWNEDDFAVAAQEFARLWPEFEGTAS